MEHYFEPKNRSKVEISGMASTSFEVSDLPIKKIVKQEQKEVCETEVPDSNGSGSEDVDQLPSKLLEQLGRAANDEASSYPFRHMLDDYMAAYGPKEPGKDVSREEKFYDVLDPEEMGERDKTLTNTFTENSENRYFQDATNFWMTSPRVGDEYSAILELSGDSGLPTDHNQSNCGLQVSFYKSFEQQLHPFDSAFSMDVPMRYLKTPSLGLIREESPVAMEDLHGLRTAPHGDISQGEQHPPSQIGPKYLEVYLADYIKGIEPFKSQTNNLQMDFSDNRGCLKRCSGDSQNEKEEYFEVSENKSGSSFASAVSFCTQQQSCASRNTVEGDQCLQKFLSLTQLTEKTNGARKSKSESDLNDSRTGISDKETRLSRATEELNDSYEKIQAFASSEVKKSRRGGLIISGSETEGKATFADEEEEEFSELDDDDDFDDDDDDDFGVSMKFKEPIRWSPTLPELTEIYLRILKDNRKILQRGAMAEPCFSSYMMSFLQKKLQEKKYKMDLIDFSKSFRDSFRPKDWKPGRSKDRSFGLEEYVAAFQEILHSNLSVNQISRLNIALAKFQDYHDKTHRYLRRMAKKQAEREKQMRKKGIERENSGIQSNTSTDQEEVRNITFSSPRNLEAVLKTFNSDASKEQVSKEDKNKLLVTVELSGNDVLVNSLSYINNEASMTLEKQKNKSTSQLIIENWTKARDTSPIWRGTESTPKGSRTTMDAEEVDRLTEKFEQQNQQQQSRHGNEVPEFEYDQLLLRTQHPIEAIMESSESKLDKTQENSEEKLKSKPKPEGHSEILQDNSTAIKSVLQDALTGKIYLKDLFHELGYSDEEFGKTINRIETLDERPQPKLQSSWPKKKADIVRSMFDLKKSPSGKATKPRSTYLCYPSVMNFQEKAPKKKIKDKRRYSAIQTPAATNAFKARQSKNSRSPNRAETSKKPPIKEPEPVATEPERPSTTSDAGTTTVAEQNVQQVPKAQGATSECCSIELLVTEASRSTFPEDQGKPPEDPPEESNSPQTTVATATPKPSMETPDFLLHCSKSDADGMSFRSEIIHSDSFLKYCTPIRVTQSKLKSLFKCSSDFKFYPGRVCESSEETEPFITFVLTPTQNETAGLPGNMVQVVQKDKTSAPAPAEDEEQEPQQGTLEEIERFVMEMARLKKMALKRQKKVATQKKTTLIKPDVRSSISGSRGVLTGNSAEKKSYHEFQKRKPTNLPGSFPKAPRAAAPAVKQSQLFWGTRPSQTSWGALESDKSEMTLDDFIKKTCEVFSQFFKDKELEDEEMQRREKMQDKATEMSSNKIEAVVTDITQAEPSPSCEPRDGYDSVSVIPKELLQAIKAAIGQVDGFDGKDQIIAAIEDVENRRKKKGSKTAGKTSQEATPSPNTMKKYKTIRIKIHCKGHKCTEKNEGSSPEGDNEREADKHAPCPPAKEIKLLDSLLSSNTGENALETRNSTYFDAIEKDNEEAGGNEAAVSSQSFNEAPLAAAQDAQNAQVAQVAQDTKSPPSPGFSGMQDRSYPSLTLSDERLLTAISFEKENEEKIYKKISKYLEEGEVSYSMTLLDFFLRRTENSTDDIDSRLRLNDLLMLVENKSRNLMMNLEKNAWIKVLSLLEEAARVLDDDGIKHYKKTQLVEKIQSLNIKKLAELQECLPSTSESGSTDSGRQGNFLRVIRESFSFLKRKVVRKRSRGNANEKMPKWEDTESSESAIGIHAANGFPEMRGSPGTYNSNYLKSKLRQQRVRIERLINANGDLIAPKIGDLKNIVMMKMKSLEHYNVGESSGEGSSRGYFRGKGRKRDWKKGPRESLSRRPGYVDLVRYFMKAWDARMSLSSLSNCRS